MQPESIRTVGRWTKTSSVVCGTLTAVVLAGGARSAVQQLPTSEDYVLTSNRAGRIELGISVDEMYRAFGRENIRLVDLFKEGYFSPALEVSLPGGGVVPGIVATIREWPCGEFSVWGIDVRDPRFRTKDGFGVGSTAGDLRRSYSFKVSEEEGAHAAMIESLKMSFALSREGPLESQRVKSVWIWPDPEAVRRKRCPDRTFSRGHP